ncbi:MAG: hypothetical protein L3J43_06880 [Sulfurovum sp.]|nr:hypothetical protein [Sulfurovum sp.]
MKKHIAVGSLIIFLLIVLILFSIEESRTFILALIIRIFFFLKHNILALLSAFFLVKGKFILMLFLKKIAFLSATGLSKRYLIEKVINHNLKIHFLDHISVDIKHLVHYTKNNFKNFPIVKQIIAGLVFLGSLGFVGKFMGGMLAVKVFIAKFWSFLLAFILKFSTAIVYFFTEYLWGSWIAPLIEILIFSWLLELMERVPFLKKYIQKIYTFFIDLFEWVEVYLEKVFHIPVKHFFKFLARRIRKRIYAFIGYTKVSAWRRLNEVRILKPNAYNTLKKKRIEKNKNKNQKSYLSFSEVLKKKRKSKK